MLKDVSIFYDPRYKFQLLKSLRLIQLIEDLMLQSESINLL